MTSRLLRLSAAILALALLGCSGNGAENGDGSGGAPAAGAPATMAGATQAGAPQGGSAGSVAMTPGGYHVVGNQILDGNRQPYHFHGVSRPSLEWNPDGESITERDWDVIKTWGANVIRLPLNQVFWRTAPLYQLRVQTYVDQIIERGMDVILDLHWSEGPMPGTGAQREMADEQSLVFWSEVATMFKDNSRVLFELYNEPKLVRGGGWEVWHNGGEVGGFQAVGMTHLYEAVRATGAPNIVIMGGIDFGYNLSEVPMRQIPDAFNVAYSAHPYDFSNKMMPSWEADWGFLAATHPIIITEFGRAPTSPTPCDPAYPQQVIDYANAKGAGWVAWAWFVKDCTFPSLITDYNGAATEAGEVVKQALLAYGRN